MPNSKPKYKNKVNITKKEFAALYNKMTQTELAKRLNVSQPAIVYHAKKFGLTKSREKRIHFKD